MAAPERGDVLQRYELLYEAALIAEAVRDTGNPPRSFRAGR